MLLVPVVGEAFTEFYILGLDGKARDYPAGFTLEGNRVVLVNYGMGEGREVAGDSAVMILGIINREQAGAAYTVKVSINGEPLSVFRGEAKVAEIGPVNLKAILDPWKATPFVAISGKRVYSRIHSFPKPEDNRAMEFIEAGCVDTAFLKENGLSLVYSRSACENPDLMEVRQFVYLLKEAGAN